MLRELKVLSGIKESKEEALYQWGVSAFNTARTVEKTPKSRSEFVGTTIGCKASRLGFTKEELQKWMQTYYGKLFVVQNQLEPGMDLKPLSALVLKAAKLK